MGAGLGIACRSVVIGLAVTAKEELSKFSAVLVPLEYDRFRPIVPDWRGDDEVLVDRDCRLVGRWRPTSDLGQAIRICAPKNFPIIVSEAQIARKIESRMDCKTTRIGVVAAKRTARRRRAKN